MSSTLRAKLNAMKTQSPAPPARMHTGGLVRFADQVPAPDSLYALAPEALRRIGWSGKPFDIERCLFLDTETTGLSGGAGTVAFLVGLGTIERGVMTIEQLFMRDYSDEAELLAQLSMRMKDRDCVVTFNGRSFDLPLLRARFTLNRMREFPELFDLDLLHPARRAWKLRIESCRLSNIEEQILGIARVDDLPGAEVPARYFDFLKTGDMGLIDDVLRHNKQDIATLAQLLAALAGVYRHPEQQAHALDLFSLGKALERQGESAQARELYRLSAVPPRAGALPSHRAEDVAGQANWRLFRLCLRARDVSAAISTLEQMIARGQMGVHPHIELAKIYEHRVKNYRRALDHTACALRDCAPAQLDALEWRKARIMRKMKNRRIEPKWE
ncbi:MAG: ribonuclease H-like domain-containing protein [Christensenellales bacterium]|jgi:uncharacterized protein YprB with RNaseH-like and TPR domain